MKAPPSRFGSEVGLNLIEVTWFVLIVCGAMMGVMIGLEKFGFWGAIAGVPIGGAVAFGVAMLGALLLGLIMKVLVRYVDPPPPTSSVGKSTDDRND